MRVLHVLPSVAPSRGGPTTYGLRLARALARAGVAVELWATRAELDERGERAARDALCDVPLALFPALDLARLEVAPGLLLALGRRLASRSARVDLVHLHTVFTFPVAAAARLCGALGVPYVLRPAGTLDARCLALGRATGKRLAIAAYVRRALDGAAAVHATSEAEREQLCRLAPRANVVVVEPGADLVADAARGAAETGGERVVGVLGRLHPIKRIEVLIDALARLPADVALEVGGAGEPTYVASLRARAASRGVAERVRFLGHVDGPARSAHLARARLLAFPSSHESFGLAVAEAMGAARPVVVSAEVALAQAIVAAGAGRVARGEDPAAFARAIAALLDDDAARAEAGQAAFALCRARFTWEAAAARTIALYEAILAR